MSPVIDKDRVKSLVVVCTGRAVKGESSEETVRVCRLVVTMVWGLF